MEIRTLVPADFPNILFTTSKFRKIWLDGWKLNSFRKPKRSSHTDINYTIWNQKCLSVMNCFPDRSVLPSKRSTKFLLICLFYCKGHIAAKSLKSHKTKRFAGFWEVLLIGLKLVVISIVLVSHYHLDLRHLQDFSANSVHAQHLNDWKAPQYFLYCFSIKDIQINIKIKLYIH